MAGNWGAKRSNFSHRGKVTVSSSATVEVKKAERSASNVVRGEKHEVYSRVSEALRSANETTNFIRRSETDGHDAKK